MRNVGLTVAILVDITCLGLVVLLALQKKRRDRPALLPAAIGLAFLALAVAIGVAHVSAYIGINQAYSTPLSSRPAGADLLTAIHLCVQSIRILLAGLWGALSTIIAFILLLLTSSKHRHDPPAIETVKPSSGRSVLVIALSLTPLVFVGPLFAYASWIYDESGFLREILTRLTHINLGIVSILLAVLIVLGTTIVSVILARSTVVSHRLALTWLCILVALGALQIAPFYKSIDNLQRFQNEQHLAASS
jgi:hypothetical protein